MNESKPNHFTTQPLTEYSRSKREELAKYEQMYWKFVAAEKMYQALKDCLISMQSAKTLNSGEHLDGAMSVTREALALADGRMK